MYLDYARVPVLEYSYRSTRPGTLWAGFLGGGWFVSEVIIFSAMSDVPVSAHVPGSVVPRLGIGARVVAARSATQGFIRHDDRATSGLAGSLGHHGHTPRPTATVPQIFADARPFGGPLGSPEPYPLGSESPESPRVPRCVPSGAGASLSLRGVSERERKPDQGIPGLTV